MKLWVARFGVLSPSGATSSVRKHLTGSEGPSARVLAPERDSRGPPDPRGVHKMSKPSIKGIAITQLIEDVRSFRDRSSDCRNRVEARVSAAGLALLEEKIQTASWYPIDAYQSLTRFLWETEGQGRVEYLHQRGASSAERVLATAMYQQISFLRERYDPTDHESFARQLKLIVTLQGVFFNFTTWHVSQDPDHQDRLQIEIRDAEHFPEELCHTTAGFVTRLAAEVRETGLQWYPERARRDLVVLRMDRAPTLAGAARRRSA